MATGDLEKKIKLVLSNIRETEPIYVTKKQLPTSKTSPPFIVTDPRDVSMAHEQVGVLKTLYGQCLPEEKSLFVKCLLGEMSKKYVGVIVVTLLHTGHLGEVVSALSAKENAWKAVGIRALVWNMLEAALVCEPYRFTERDLAKIEEGQQREATSVRIAEKAALLSRKRQLPRS